MTLYILYATIPKVFNQQIRTHEEGLKNEKSGRVDREDSHHCGAGSSDDCGHHVGHEKRMVLGSLSFCSWRVRIVPNTNNGS